MKLNDSAFTLSATDLSKFSACRRATLLDREVAHGRLAPAPYRDDPAMRLLTQAVVIVVASPRLLEAECKTPELMKLANGLCGAVEFALRG